jgi:hypothetical protein
LAVLRRSQSNNPVARRPCGDWSVESEKFPRRVNGGVRPNISGEGMDTELAKVIRASAYLIAGSILMTGGTLAAAISSTIPNVGGIIGAIGSLLGLCLLSLHWFNIGVRSMPFLQ